MLLQIHSPTTPFQNKIRSETCFGSLPVSFMVIICICPFSKISFPDRQELLACSENEMKTQTPNLKTSRNSIFKTPIQTIKNE